MKKIKIVKLLLITSIIFLTGCSTPQITSPDEILEKPITSEEKNVLYTDISRYTDKNAKFIFPENAEEVSKINVKDLDNDGKQEVIVFEKKVIKNEKDKIGFDIFQKEGTQIDSVYRQQFFVDGSKIKYAKFCDLDGDGNDEIVFQIVNADNVELYIFKYKNKKIKLYAKYIAIEYPFKISIKPVGIDGNNKEYILVTFFDSYEKKATIGYFELNNKSQEYAGLTFKMVDSIKNIKNLDEIRFRNSYVFKDNLGVTITYPTLDNKYKTNIILLNKKSDEEFLQLLINEENNKFINDYYISQEYYEKGVSCLPILKKESVVNSDKYYKLISWYIWNGNYGKDVNFELKRDIFYSLSDNLQILIPDKLKSKVTVDRTLENNKNTYTFNYNVFDKIPKELKEKNINTQLFSISVLTDTNLETSQKSNVSGDESEGYIYYSGARSYIIKIINNDLAKALGIDLVEVFSDKEQLKNIIIEDYKISS